MTTASTNKDFTKIIRFATAQPSWRTTPYSIYAKIEFTEGKLSISGVEGPLSNGYCVGSCGQIDMDLRKDVDSLTPTPQWTTEMIVRFLDIWDKWHLNDLRAGSPAQTKALEGQVWDRHNFSSHYEWAVNRLTELGLQPDKGYLHNGEPYKYGSAWLHEDVPTDVLEWLQALPDADRQPAWV